MADNEILGETCTTSATAGRREVVREAYFPELGRGGQSQGVRR